MECFSLSGFSPTLAAHSQQLERNRVGLSREGTYLESLGAGFLCFPRVPVKEAPNKLNRSGFLSSTLLAPLLLRRTGTLSSTGEADGGGVLTGVPADRVLLVSASFSLKEPDSVERPNKRRLLLGSFAMLSVWSNTCQSLRCRSILTYNIETIRTSLMTARSSLIDSLLPLSCPAAAVSPNALSLGDNNSCGGRPFAALLGSPKPSPTGDRPRASSSRLIMLPCIEPGSDALHPLRITGGDPGRSPVCGGLSALVTDASATTCPFPFVLMTPGDGGPNGELLKLWCAELWIECECECDGCEWCEPG